MFSSREKENFSSYTAVPCCHICWCKWSVSVVNHAKLLLEIHADWHQPTIMRCEHAILYRFDLAWLGLSSSLMKISLCEEFGGFSVFTEHSATSSSPWNNVYVSDISSLWAAVCMASILSCSFWRIWKPTDDDFVFLIPKFNDCLVFVHENFVEPKWY